MLASNFEGMPRDGCTEKHSPRLNLNGLAPGQWRELQPLERQQIEKLLKN